MCTDTAWKLTRLELEKIRGLTSRWCMWIIKYLRAWKTANVWDKTSQELFKIIYCCFILRRFHFSSTTTFRDCGTREAAHGRVRFQGTLLQAINNKSWPKSRTRNVSSVLERSKDLLHMKIQLNLFVHHKIDESIRSDVDDPFDRLIVIFHYVCTTFLARNELLACRINEDVDYWEFNVTRFPTFRCNGMALFCIAESKIYVSSWILMIGPTFLLFVE